MLRRHGLLAWSFLAVALLAGACSADPGVESPYRAEFDDFMSTAPNDFVRGVLEDYEITQAEYDEAVARMVECASSRGVEVHLEDGGGYSIAGSGQNQAVFDECTFEHLADIEMLYNGIRKNPDNRPIEDVTVDCLKEQGVVDESYTREDLLREQGSLDMTDEKVQVCLSDPQSVLGS